MNKNEWIYGMSAFCALAFCVGFSNEVVYAEEANEPSITSVEVFGEVNEDAKGVEVFEDIDISITEEGMTNDHFLTEEGLHWSEDTYVEITKGSSTGTMDDPMFWSNKRPKATIPSFSMNNGDMGRIVNVGQTKSGKKLDLIYTVKDTNKEEWEANSKYKGNGTTRGLGFVGEQYIQNSTGNSIVTVMSGTNYVSMFYQIVEHNTFKEMPVVLSFITTDIDGAQGVQTNLDTLVRIIPKNADLSVDEYGIIYDNAKPKGNKLNGSRDLPKGGYLGAGFVSHFDYTFYAPTPKRIEDKAPYTFCARYDLFGSALQAHVSIQSVQRLDIEYVNTKGEVLEATRTIKGTDVLSNVPERIEVDGYQWSHMNFAYPQPNRIVLRYVYNKKYTTTIRYVDTKGKQLAPDVQKNVVEGQRVSIKPKELKGYVTPDLYETKVDGNIVHTFVYEAVQSEQKVPTIINKLSQEVIKEVQKEPTKIQMVYPSVVVPNLQNTYTYSYSVPAVSTPQKKESTKKKKNWFEINTGMPESDQKQFFQGLKDVKAYAEKKYKNDPNKKDKVNHALQSAVAYQVYEDDFLQNLVNDFYSDENSNEINEIFKRYAEPSENPLIIDLPHLSTALASSYKQSNRGKELIKYILSSPPANLSEKGREINLLYINSLTGDQLTIMGEGDREADMDAVILKYHPKYKNLDYDIALKDYYNTENLSKKRKQLYDEAVEEIMASKRSIPDVTATLTVGGLGLMVLGLILKYRNKIARESKPVKVAQPNYNKKIVNPIAEGIIKLKKKTKKVVSKAIEKGKSLVKTATTKLKKTAKKAVTKIKTTVKKTTTKVKNTIKKINNVLNKTSKAKVKVAQPDYNYFMSKKTAQQRNTKKVAPVKRVAQTVRKAVKRIGKKRK